MRGDFCQAFGESGSPVMRMTCQRWRCVVAAAYSMPSSDDGLPACTILPNAQLDRAWSPDFRIAIGIVPLSSINTSTYFEWRPESVLPRASGSAVFDQLRASRNQVS